MSQADFYIIKSSQPEARYPVLCRLASKIAEQKKTLYIQCDDQKQAQQIDDLLWSFNDTSFIPHAIFNDEQETHPNILIGTQPAPESHQNIVLNLSQHIPENLAKINRILEIVCADADWKQVSRRHYQHYKEADLTIKTHTI